MAEGDNRISRSALGRKASIGDLYDVRRDALLPKNIFLREPPTEATTQMNHSARDQTYFSSEKLADRFEGFGIESELALSVSAGLVQPRAASEFLLEQRKGSRDVQWTLSQKISTLVEAVNTDHEILKEIVNPEAFCEEEATHVIVGIEWGANTFITVSHEARNEEESSLWRERLSVYTRIFTLEIAKVGDDADLNIDELPINKQELDELRFKAFADLPVNEETTGQSVGGFLKLMRGMPERVVNETCGKGCQVLFRLLPLHEFVRHSSADVAVNRSLQCVSKKVAKQIIEKMDEIEVLMAMLRDHKEQLQILMQLIPRSLLEDLEAFSHTCENDRMTWIDKLKNELVKLRSTDEEDEIELQILLRNVLRTTKLGEITTFTQNESLQKRKELYDRLLANRIILSNEVEFDGRRWHMLSVFVFFFSFDRDYGSAAFEDALANFLSLARSYPERQFVAVDEDASGSMFRTSDTKQGLRIALCENGSYTCQDYLKVLQVRKSSCTVLCRQKMFPEQKNPRSMPLEVPCPCFAKDHHCSTQVHKWRCHECLQEVDYDFQGGIHCDCGWQTIEAYGFHCVHEEHGSQFEPFHPNLRQHLAAIKPMKEIIILVIGETGVGKSTWINAIANYITHENWKEACEDKLTNLIPTSFSLSAPTKNGTHDIVVSVGKEDSNEVNGIEGKSATKHPKSYVFTHNYTAYRIIDTPGIGDTDGLEADKRNIEEILHYIGRFNEIHLICFLMKPDECRLTERFEFCLLQLIKQFHSNAARNIVFCFTYASSTGFQIGQTNRYLSKLTESIKQKQKVEIPLNENTEFVFDNMAYRYLCAMHANVPRSLFESLEKLYEQSFKHSRSETLRLLKQADTVMPHNPKETLSLNFARNLIVKLADPLVRISRAVRTTLEDIEDNQKELMMYRNNDKELRKRLQRRIVITRFNMTMELHIICKNCSELKSYYGKDRDPYIECDPSAAATDPLKIWHGKKLNTSEAVKPCCEKCGVNFEQVHCDRVYTAFHEEQLEEDETVRQLMDQNASWEEILQAKLNYLESHKNKIEMEYTKITQASIMFAIFLKRNSITTYNDATERYLNQLIELEREKGPNVTERERTYKRMLEEYHQEKRIIEESLMTVQDHKKSHQEITPETIKELAAELQQLPVYGADISKALQTADSLALVQIQHDTYYTPSKKRGILHYLGKKLGLQ